MRVCDRLPGAVATKGYWRQLYSHVKLWALGGDMSGYIGWRCLRQRLRVAALLAAAGCTTPNKFAGTEAQAPVQDVAIVDLGMTDAAPVQDGATVDLGLTDAAPDGGAIDAHSDPRPVKVGIFYVSLEYQPAVALLAEGIPRLTVEDAVRNEGIELKDLPFGGPRMLWHTMPARGFYCVYKPRDRVNTPNHDFRYPNGSPIVGCDDLGQAVSVDDLYRGDVMMLEQAGIDFAYLDLTNFPYYTAKGDVQSLRPLELMAEKIVELRATGSHAALQIAPWVPFPQRSDSGACPPRVGDEGCSCDRRPFDDWRANHSVGCEYSGDDCSNFRDCTERLMMFDKVLEVMNRPANLAADVFLRHQGKRVVFVADPPRAEYDRAAAAQRAAAENLLLVRLWHSNNRSETRGAGAAIRGSACMTSADSNVGTTLVFEDLPCNQLTTDDSPIGRVGVVRTNSPQTMAGRPFTNSGKQGGFVLRKMWHTIIDYPEDYDYVLVNNWNEHTALVRAPHYGDSNRYWLSPMPGALDLSTTCASADSADICFQGGLSNLHYSVDMWGAEFSRAVEPVINPDSGQQDRSLYEALTDCIALYRSGGSCTTHRAQFSACCAPHPDPLHIVHSYKATTALWTHHVLFTDEDPNRATLMAGMIPGKIPYVPYSPPSYVGGLPNVALQRETDPTVDSMPDGPFMTYKNAAVGRRRLIRCKADGSSVYTFRTGAACPSGFSYDGDLGYISTVRTSATARPLRKCVDQGRSVPWLSELACERGSGTHYGFVR